MAKGNKDAKLLRKTYGIKHMAAIRLIEEHGLEKATEIVAERAARGEYKTWARDEEE